MIEEVLESSEPGKCHYLPHNPVIREDKDIVPNRNIFWNILSLNSPPAFVDKTILFQTTWFE